MSRGRWPKGCNLVGFEDGGREPCGAFLEAEKDRKWIPRASKRNAPVLEVLPEEL